MLLVPCSKPLTCYEYWLLILTASLFSIELPAGPLSLPFPKPLKGGQWLADYRIWKLNPLPQDGANSVAQFLLQSFSWGQVDTSLQLRPQPCSAFFPCSYLLSEKITFTRIPTSDSASREHILRQPRSEQFIVLCISFWERVLEIAMYRWGNQPWAVKSHSDALRFTLGQSNQCRGSAP